MSYEGYTQNLCANGHYYVSGEGIYNDVGPCQCGALAAFTNHVDDTNCDEYGIIPTTVFTTLLLEEEKVETCNLGHVHVVAEAVYRIPSEEEAKAMRHYWCSRVRDFRPLQGE